ncbi:MAG: GntR family transcriptional regulator [Acidimicrobiia bacterium]|nr:GntR family transcriptional regulator [Acidimicrobiia bacterium]
MRQIRYQQIADDLRGRLDDGDFPAGGLLPSEAELSRLHGASRVTVRRALELLRDEGRVASRQGLGWFASADPVRQSLGRLGTLEAQLGVEGRRSERKVLDYRTVSPPPRVRTLLGGDRVLRVRRLNLADGHPFAVITVWCPADLADGLTRQRVEAASFYDLLAVPLGGATQTIAAGVANLADAEVLSVPEGSPVLRCERVTRSEDGRVVLVSEHVFPAHLTEFVVDLPSPSASIAPSGLRLVEGEG